MARLCWRAGLLNNEISTSAAKDVVPDAHCYCHGMSNIRAAYPRKGVVQPRILRLLAQPVREMPGVETLLEGCAAG